jgi:GNAT superfamily N-acetyltransferase
MDHQRKGYGRALAEDLERWAASRGVDVVAVGTSDEIGATGENRSSRLGRHVLHPRATIDARPSTCSPPRGTIPLPTRVAKPKQVTQ